MNAQILNFPPTPLPANSSALLDASVAPMWKTMKTKLKQGNIRRQREEAKRLRDRIDAGFITLDTWRDPYTGEHFDPRVARIVERYLRRRDRTRSLSARVA